MTKKKSVPVVSLPLPGIPAKRVRPVTGKAMSDAERARRYRARKAAGIIVMRHDKSKEI